MFLRFLSPFFSSASCLVPKHDFDVKGTSVVFPGTIMGPTGKSLELLAVGIRQMSIFKFGLYTIGLYSEADAVKCLRTSGPSLTVNQAIQLILDRQFEWGLRIVPLRNGSMAHLRDALVRRLKQSANGDNSRVVEIGGFSSLFPNSPLEMGKEILFHWNRNDGLLVTKGEKEYGRHAPLWTCQEILRLYTDERTSTVPQLVNEFKDTIEKINGQ